MKRILQKILSSIIVVITISNLLCATVAKASNVGTSTSGGTTIESLNDEEENNLFETLFGGLGFIIDGIVGLLSKVIQLPLLLLMLGAEALFTGIASLGDSDIQGFITPDDIFFNRVGLTKINFFDTGTSDSVMKEIRVNIAKWYYILRILSIIILLAILIYVGIQMAISTVASDQAKYKKMLMDWATSFAILFFLGYIIMFTLGVNDALIEMLGEANKVVIGDGVVTELAKDIATGGATKSWGATIVFAALIGMTLRFLLAYVKRMLTIGFLIIISPLITITYSIDKMKDGQAQALNTWLKEFMFNVLIQPFHIIIYLVFVSSALNVLATSPSLAKMLLAVICMGFVWTAEKIVHKIFGFDKASSLGETIAATHFVKDIGRTATKVAGAAGAAGRTIAGTGFGQNIQQRVGNSRVGQTYSRVSNSRPIQAIKNFPNTSAGKVATNLAKTGGALGFGAVAMGAEIGAGTPANALHVGLEGYNAGKAFFGRNVGAPGSPEQTRLSEEDLKKFATLFAKNNPSFSQMNTNQSQKNNFKSYAQSLIGANMSVLDTNIQNALSQLVATAGTDYSVDPNNRVQYENLKKLYDAALDTNTDFNNSATNPLGHTWTTEEKSVVQAIQTKNLAQAVNATHGQYQAAGRTNPTSDIDTFIDGMQI